jgi:hypothetical protein
MIEQWTELAILYERMVMEAYGVGQYPVAEIVPIVVLRASRGWHFHFAARPPSPAASSIRLNSDDPASGSRVSKSSGTAPRMLRRAVH